MDELKELLENVSGSYKDFVDGVLLSLENLDEERQMMIDYIKDNPDKTSSDIIEFLDELEDAIEEEED